ncbi:hypothetical protein FRB94_010847 [Tulasnella sp. JGI-2019a]|nr:hypothetical protein FRB94_010847 [Tulasnella sp. JGI-2019a]
MSMPAWFDIKELPSDVDKDVDVQGIWASAREINAIITSEIGGGIPENKIILGGLTTEIKLAGLVCLSGRLLYDTIKESMTSESRNLPIFWGHGTADPVVAFSRGQDALHRPRGN